MMNVVALCLILCSVLSNGFFSPPQEKQKQNGDNQREDLIVKESNRMIMVEFEREARPKDPNQHYPTPSPPPAEPSLLEQKMAKERAMASGVVDGTKAMLSKESSMASGAIDSTKEKLKEASSVLTDSAKMGNYYNPKELICDAYGKCKHKLTGVFGKVKESASEEAHDVEEAGEKALGKAKETLGKAKDSIFGEVGDTGETVMGKTKEGLGKVKQSVYETGEAAMEKTKEGLGKAKQSVSETGEAAMEKTKEGLDRAKQGMYETGEAAMGKAKEAKQSISETAQEAEEMTMENVENIGQGLKKGHNSLWDERSLETKASGLLIESRRNFSSIFHRGRDAFYDAAHHATSKEVVDPTMGVVHLLGLATAYGISVWVTFVSSHVLAGALPRQQFGVLQSKIYPVYFRAMLGSIGSALVAHALRSPHFGFKSLPTYNMMVSLGFVLFNLIFLEPQATKVMFDKMKLEKEEGRGRTGEGEEEDEVTDPCGGPFVTTTNNTEVTPLTTTTTTEPSTGADGTLRAEIAEQPEEVRARLGALDKRLKNLNSMSSLLNIATLMALTWQLVYLGRDITWLITVLGLEGERSIVFLAK